MTMRPLRVAFRVDASRAIGTGHVRRCLALAQALKKIDAQIFFVCRRHDNVSSHLIPTDENCLWLEDSLQTDFNADEAPPTPHSSWGGVAWQQDADQTLDVLKSNLADWLVVDHYAWDKRWHQRVTSALAIRLLVIDDLADRSISADALLDQNLHPDHLSKYQDCIDFKNRQTRFITGPRHALLSEKYSLASRYQFSKVVESIGIFMGGADQDDLSTKVLLACREIADFKGHITLVSSLQSPHYQTHVLLAAKWPHTQIVHDLPDLSSFFASHDLQIGTGGGAAWERSCIGVPTLAVIAALNQQAVLPQLADLNAVRVIELSNTQSSMQAFGTAVADLIASTESREKLALESSRLVDGRGSERVANVLALSSACELALRPAMLTDASLLLEWFNESQTRQNAFNADQITRPAHTEWLRKKLANKNSCQLYIAQTKSGMPLGMIRFDRDVSTNLKPDHELWWLSYSVDVSFRGLGVARVLVDQGIERLAGEVVGAFVVKALVKTSNTASRKIFSRLSFTESYSEHMDQAVCGFHKLVRSA